MEERSLEGLEMILCRTLTGSKPLLKLPGFYTGSIRASSSLYKGSGRLCEGVKAFESCVYKCPLPSIVLSFCHLLVTLFPH